MALRAAVYSCLPVALLGTAMAPGCGCEVSHCCDGAHFNNSEALAEVFNGSLPSGHSHGYSWYTDRAGLSVACAFLNLVPGFFDENGTCSGVAAGVRNSTVCEAVAASPEASGRLQAGRSILSVFLGPGTCAEGGACWESRGGIAAYEWDSFGAGSTFSSWCQGGPLPWRGARPALAWSTACSSEGGFHVRAEWVDSNATDIQACSRNYSGGIQATLGADGWMGGSDGSPRWRCFDVPRGDTGPSDFHISVYSVGDLPCTATTTTTTPGAATTNSHIAVSGSPRTSLAAFAHAAATTAAVGAMM